jgi:hypothetical protein
MVCVMKSWGVALMFTVHSKLAGLWLLSAQMGLIYGPKNNGAHYMGADLKTAVKFFVLLRNAV